MASNLGFGLGKYGYTALPRQLTKEETKLLSVVFQEADKSRKGYLTNEDIKVAMVELFGYKPTKHEVQQVLDRYGETEETEVIGLSLQKFTEAMTEKMVKRDEDDEIRQTFMAFDVQCRGFLTYEDLQRVFGQVAPHLPVHSSHSAFRELDRDGDGRISYKDFEFMMKYDVTDHI